ncbi:MAG: glycosyltransferase family 39 protein [Polyangiales bacterium]
MKRDFWISLDIACVALVARLAVIVHALTEPVWDGFYYDFGARRIAEGHGYSEDLVIAAADGTERVAWHAWAHYPVGYSGFLAGWYKIFGHGPMIGPFANALTGALLALVAHRIALHAFESERRALIAGLLVALDPGLVLYSGALMTEPLAALLILSSILLARKGTALSGISLGLATLVRPNAILVAPILAFLRGKRLFTWFGRAVLVGVFTLATVAPWTYRNCKVMDACAFVSTNAGWNLVIGSAPGATGKFEFLVGHNPEGEDQCAEGGQVAQDRCWYAYGVKIIRRDFKRWLGLIPAKLHYTMDLEWFPINYLREARPDRVSARAHIVVGKGLTAIHHVLVVAAAMAAIGWSRKRTMIVQGALFLGLAALATKCIDLAYPTVWPLGVAACVLPFLPLPGSPRRNAIELAVAWVILTTLLTHAIFFGEDRYHLVATPAFAILAAGLGRRSRLAA